jgi:hypothetical protein
MRNLCVLSVKTLLSGLLCVSVASSLAQHPDTLWFKYDNRFLPNKCWRVADYDTLLFQTSMARGVSAQEGKAPMLISYPKNTEPGQFMFTRPGRYLYRPSSMNCDFTNSNSQWCFERSKESEHFVVFWEKGVNFDQNYILERAERAWDVYVNQLGFLTPGQSKGTDNYKIVMRMYNSGDWIASGSGEDKAVGTLNLSPSAYQARGGHTVAHEVGHTFQYLTDVDNGANGRHGFGWGFAADGSGDNCFWEDCANWQGYKVYPERQFSDGEYFEAYMRTCHLNLLHEDARYNNCYYQDYLCQLYGQDFIGRLWRESNFPEDPVDAIRRIQGLSQDDFSKVMYDCFAHMCTWDIECVRTYAKHRVGAHPLRLQAVTVEGEEWYQPSAEYCPQNYGYNITELKLPVAGTTLKIDFEGLVNQSGYKTVYADRAGWRWGLVTLMADGTTQYGEMQSAKSGSIEYTVPADASRLWLVVMGAPTQWWHHEWSRWADAPATNDEQWPYRVRTQGTSPVGLQHTYTDADFPADYQRHDTTIVVHANLAASSTSYSSVRVQYDMDAISEALGVTTSQLHTIMVGSNYNPRFAGANPSGTLTNSTTTTTSSATCYGHWFTTAGLVTNYGSTSAIFAEMYPASFECNVGQYPGRLTAGKTYTVRQVVLYRPAGGKTYRATIEVHLHVLAE